VFYLQKYELLRPLHRRKLFIASSSIDPPQFRIFQNFNLKLKFGYRKLQLQVEV